MDTPKQIPFEARLAFASKVREDIEAYAQRTYDSGPRSHLGASVIGDDCPRKLWYGFRWVFHKKHDGRMQRLFQRGHREEAAFIEYLRGIGVTVNEHDVDGKQFRVAGVGGHFGGSCDGQSLWPDDWRELLYDHEKLLLEFKTQGTGRGFNQLVADGVKSAKPVHYGQMCVYGAKLQIHYALYMAVNKNDDELHIELVELDWDYATQLVVKAQNVITSQIPPDRIPNASSAFFKCKICDYNGVCNKGQPAQVNCRSCKLARPADDAQWICGLHNAAIPAEFILKGCGAWESII